MRIGTGVVTIENGNYSFLQMRSRWLSYELERQGLQFAQSPVNSQDDLFNRVFVRAEPCSETVRRKQTFVPQSGQMASQGVFFGDNPHSLMHHDTCVYFVAYGRRILLPSHPIVLFPSLAYSALAASIILEKGYRPGSIAGGCEVDAEIYGNNVVYDCRSGVLTLPYPLDRAAIDCEIEYIPH